MHALYIDGDHKLVKDIEIEGTIGGLYDRFGTEEIVPLPGASDVPSDHTLYILIAEPSGEADFQIAGNSGTYTAMGVLVAGNAGAGFSDVTVTKEELGGLVTFL